MLDTQARQLLDLIAALDLPPPWVAGVVQAREAYRQRRFATQPDPRAMASVSDHEIVSDGHRIAIRDFRPKSLATRRETGDTRAPPALLYLHGGGWTIGDLDTHDTLCRELADTAQCAVFSVDYRMGPEHRFPAAVIDADNAFQWLLRESTALGIDASRIAIGGDSAGGNLATVATLLARDRGGPMPMFQLLIYPATDQRAGHDSHQRNGEGYLLTRDLMNWFREQYHADQQEYLDWRASPLLATDLSGLPPALVLLAGYDPLLDEGLDYAERLSAAGVSVDVVRFDAQIHGFITMGRMIDDANRAVARCGEALRTAFRSRR